MQTAGESLSWLRRAIDGHAGGDGDGGGPSRGGGTGGERNREESAREESAREAGRHEGRSRAEATREEEEAFHEYDRLAAGVPAGSGGVVFLPYLNGERTPHWDPFARGVFFGLGLSTGKGHLVRAVMEGVAMAFRQNIETVEALGVRVDEVRAVGGGLRSQVWLSILADTLGKALFTGGAQDPGNLGNVLLCGKAIGLFPSVEEAAARAAAADGSRRILPERSPVLERQYATYLALYRALKETFRVSCGEA